MDNFFVTLPSSSSNKIYPNNKLGDYTVQLSKEFNLDGDWEVAIVELFYPHTFRNINEGENMLDVRIGKIGQQEIHTIEVTPSYYHNGTALADGINRAIEKKIPAGMDNLAFSFDKHSRTFSMFLNSNVTVSAPQGSQIGEYIGMISFFVYNPYIVSKPHDKSIPYESKTNKSLGKRKFKKSTYAQRLDLDKVITLPTISTLWICSDIVEYSNVGNIMLPLLTIVNVRQGQRGKNIHVNFDRPHYIPVAKRTFHSIRITLINNQRDIIPFDFGEVTVMLHFKRRKSINTNV